MSAPKTEPTDENTVEIDSLADWWRRYQLAKEAEKLGKAHADAAKAKITELLDQTGAEFGTIEGKLVCRWRPVPTAVFQGKKFAEAHPDLAADFTITQDRWRLDQA